MTMNATKMTPMEEMIMEKMRLEKMENAVEEKVTQASVKKNLLQLIKSSGQS